MNSWLFFSLLTPFFWGFSNAMDTAVRRHFLKSDLAATVFLAFTRLPLILAFFLIFPLENLSGSAVLWMIFGGLLWMVPFILYYRSMAFEEASRVVLLLQLDSLWILLFAFFLILGHAFPESVNEPIEISVNYIGKQMLNYGDGGFVLPFEVVSVLLLAALVGSIAIAFKTKAPSSRITNNRTFEQSKDE